VWCIQFMLGQCEAKATVRTRQDLSDLGRIRSMSSKDKVPSGQISQDISSHVN